MTDADVVFEDALRERNRCLTPWHLRCVEAYLAQLATASPFDFDRIAERLVHDLRDPLDAQLVDAAHDNHLYRR